MTVPELLQLYAPLAGLLALAFWVGMLSQKVADQKEDISGLKTEVSGLKEAEGEGGISDRLVRLEVNSENTTKSVEGIERSLQGIQRQLGNIMQKGGAGGVVEMRHD